MSPVELPCFLFLLDANFLKALWDTGAEKSFLSTYQKICFYKQVKKSSTQVITAQGAKCRSMGVGEVNIRIRISSRFGIPMYSWDRLHSESKIILDFDWKSLAIQHSQDEDIKVDDGICALICQKRS
ncbi:uncharacterized protein TNCV_1713951 [Trichonephila clavipes]|nr:uncharacterized protein TNCV_1713951 [Trichonephila clavipes]